MDVVAYKESEKGTTLATKWTENFALLDTCSIQMHMQYAHNHHCVVKIRPKIYSNCPKLHGTIQACISLDAPAIMFDATCKPPGGIDDTGTGMPPEGDNG